MRLLDREHRSPPPPPQPAPAPPTANSHLEAPDEPTVRFRFFFFSDSQRTADEPVPLAKPVSRDIFNRVRLLQTACFQEERASPSVRPALVAGAASALSTAKAAEAEKISKYAAHLQRMSVDLFHWPWRPLAPWDLQPHLEAMRRLAKKTQDNVSPHQAIRATDFISYWRQAFSVRLQTCLTEADRHLTRHTRGWGPGGFSTAYLCMTTVVTEAALAGMPWATTG
eukprot:m.305209 g.305209  ORF g.305209 m.305209 type:complete len:225 (-) comp23012_c3_seq61:145-819(-)